MIPLAISLFGLLAPSPNTQSLSSQDPPALGSHETAPKNTESAGFTLDKLHGMPMVRPVWVPPQPQIWVYPQYFGGYSGGYARNSYQYGLGGYRPPTVGGYTAPLLLFVR
jgi:hypothetical protein